MNRAERIFRLHQLLKGGAIPGMGLLMEELHTTRSTINRDFDYLRTFLGAPIRYCREQKGYHYDPDAPEFELPGLWFNQSELHALLASAQLLENVQPGLLEPHIGPLRARIRQLLAQGGHDADTVTRRILLQPFARRELDADVFGVAAGAVLDGRVLDIHYHGRERNQPSERRVHPHRLLHYRDNWYLIAQCEQAGALRTFSLDRIGPAVAGDAPAQAPDEAALDRHIGASFGIFTGAARHWAVLRFTSDRAQWVADERWHPDQIGQWRGDSYELQVPYADPRELVMDILKYGPDVEVVAPPGLRDQVAQRLAAAAARYR